MSQPLENRHPVPERLNEANFRAMGLPVLTREQIATIETDHRRVVAQEQAAGRRKARVALWAEKCPLVYREPFKENLVPECVDRGEISKVLNWNFGPRGLYVVGETGHGKSRAVGDLLTRAYIEQGRSVQFIDGFQFAVEAGAKLGSPVDAMAWLNSLCKADILWIDDFSKRWTPATEEAAFGIVERRTSRGLPIVITNNNRKEAMLNKAHDKSVVEPMLRRLRDYCEPAEF